MNFLHIIKIFMEVDKIKLFDLFLQEYFAICEHLKHNLNIHQNKIVMDNKIFYALLDKNLYLKRNEKLKIYKQLHLINCNSKGFTSVVYDKNSKKSLRKIVLNLDSYYIMKKLYEINING